MIFSELYSVYYHTVAKILTKALKEDVTEGQLQQVVLDHAFSESIMTILPALKSGKWQLLGDDLTPVIYEVPTMPLTTLEKRWLKAIAQDPRMALFDVQLPDLGAVEPLFTREDYRIFDQYENGDPFEEEAYIRHYRLIRQAITQKQPVDVVMENQYGKEVAVCVYPQNFEYSLKDDKIRVIVEGSWIRQINLGRVHSCRLHAGAVLWKKSAQPNRKKELILEVTDERGALERSMLHFAHFEKRAERLDGHRYLLHVWYDGADEKEMVIRVLSFGPLVKVKGPEAFIALIKQKLISQKSCGL